MSEHPVIQAVVVSSPNKGGRPSKFSDITVDEICSLLAEGEPLAAICRRDGMPGLRTVYDWAEQMPDVAARIARAREAGEQVIAADCLLIADDASGDYRMGDKGLIVDTDHIQRSKLRIETRLKLLAKWNPRKWGDKVEHEHSGRIGLEQLVAGTKADEK